MSPYDKAVQFQNLAADPKHNVFVSANAGSGKTHVLVNRVSRILLASPDVEPEHILCLTYTKAAASEMQTRLFKTLGDWSVMPKDKLTGVMKKLHGDEKAEINLNEARKLFAKALETPEGLKVQTIHAFCERLLARFPIEAGILPGFEPLDEAEATSLFEQVWQGLLEKALHVPDSELAKALTYIVGGNANSTIESLRNWMAYNIPKIEKWDNLEDLRQLLGVKVDDSLEAFKTRIWEETPKDDLKQAIKDLMASGKSAQVTHAEKLSAAFSCDNPVEAYDAYTKALFKKDDFTPSSMIGGKNISPTVDRVFSAARKLDTDEMMRMSEAGAYHKSLLTWERTQAVFTISKAFSSAYRDAKIRRRILDFSDQIELVARLLTRLDVSDWVRYKLDMGIKHILVDEAQDTSPVQWDIIDALSEQFDFDEDKAHNPRTMFAVGDEKQSIYSFQGADPSVFMRKSQTVTGEDKAIRFRMSFRSAPAILEAVDAVFVDQQGVQAMFDPASMRPANDLMTHNAHRDIQGLVELWPLAPAPENPSEELAWDPRPVDSDRQDSSRETLAREIAKTVKQWLDRRELVTVRQKMSDGKTQEIIRPMQAGDILILVKKHSGSFFNAVIRNLKREGVAVAGADRLVLSESLAVQDLMSLARFACLPQDDLALAEVLKSPLFNVSEEQLFKVAHGREGRLWQALQSRPEDWMLPIIERLNYVLKISKQRAPYEFFAGVLNMIDADGVSTLRAFYQRLSMEIEDPVNAFLAKALDHQRKHAPSLQHFVQSFGSDKQELKREMDDGANQVRVMTVYGAKGLEAPVVILPDTSQLVGGRDALDSGMLSLPHGGFARPGHSGEMPEVLAAVKDAQVDRAREESMRLLYVAMTRAESRLLICGYFSGRRSEKNKGQVPPEGCWHDWVGRALDGLTESHYIETPFNSDDFKGIAFGSKPTIKTGENIVALQQKIRLPEWTKKRLAKPSHGSRRVTPSHLLSTSDDRASAMHSPQKKPFDIFKRGNLIHKLLELLPDIEVDKRLSAAESFLMGYQDISAALKADIISVVFNVLEAPEFSHIFAKGSRAEVSLAGHAKGLPPSLYLNAQIDRLAVTSTDVYIIDYKSNRPPPHVVDDVSDLYLGQMAAYRALGRALYPKQKVHCGLLWTDGPHMMMLPDALLDNAIVKITTQA